MTVRTESLQRSEPAEKETGGGASLYLGRRAEKERWRIAVAVAKQRLGDRRRKNKASSRV